MRPSSLGPPEALTSSNFRKDSYDGDNLTLIRISEFTFTGESKWFLPGGID